MNKVKMFFVAAALVLTTVGVFAGKSKFTSPLPNLYLYNTSTGYLTESTNSLNGSILQYNTTTGTPGTISYGTSLTYGLYTKIGTLYYPIYW